MPLCKCSRCIASTNGIGKNFHRTTVARHMRKEQMRQYLDDAYQGLQDSEGNFYSEENLCEENLREENLYEENFCEERE